MADISELGAIDEDVPFDFGVADALIAAFDGAASAVDGQAGSRASYVSTGAVDFRGHFSELFTSNAQVAAGDATELSNRLREVATGARRLKEEARKEQQRRQKAREWKKEQDHRNAFEKFGDWLTGGEDPPVGPPAEPPTIPVSAPVNGARKTPAPGSGGGGGGGTSSARPANLRQFATGSQGLNDELRSRPGALRGRLSDFAASCRWGRLDADGVVTGFDKWLTANDEDVRWATTVADAFTVAGGEGAISTVADSALAAALQARGIDASRRDLTIDPPQAYGHPPTTGYADDPVNTATGNFVETETDLTFTGGSAQLEFSRTYNSADRPAADDPAETPDGPVTRPFGPGWSSIIDQRLELADDGATLVLPDGRRVLFPRLGDGWDRAPGENLWLDSIPTDTGTRLIVSDNAGQRRTFTSTGVWLATSRGAGTTISAIRDADGRLAALESERGRTINLTWGTDRRVIAITSSDGRRVEYRYDPAGRLVAATGPLGTRQYRWNDAGLIAAVIDADGVVEVENSYDRHGRVSSQRSPFGRETRYLYLAGRTTVVSDQDGSRSNTWIADDRGRLVGVVDADERRQSLSYDRHGNLVSVTERDGAVTVHGYDHRGRRIRTLTPSGADLTYGYDDQDRVTTVVTESGAVTEYRYATDADRNPSTMIDPEGGRTELRWQHGLLRQISDPVGVSITFDYDRNGDLIAVTDAAGHTARLERDPAGRVTAAISPSGARTRYRYDDAGLLASRRDPDGGTWHFEYSAAGRPTVVIDPLGGRTELERGPHGELTRLIDQLGQATTQTFDDLGNLAAVELPDGSSWRFVHDALSRLTATIDPDGGRWRREYDRNGDLVAITDPAGVRRDRSVDPAANTVRLGESDPVSGLRFDPLGRPIAADRWDDSAELISYDRCGRPVELLDADGGLTVLRRDAAGRVVAEVSPSGATTRYEYDDCGRMSAVIDPAGARTMIEYDPDGRVVRRVLPTGETAWTEYDPMGRVLAHFEPGHGLARYGYDLLGRVVRSTDSWYGHRRFRYDAAGRLVEVINGNGGSTRFDHDPCGRPIAITDPLGGVTRRAYNALGQIVAETDPLGRTTTAEYDGGGRQTAQTDPAGQRIAWTYDDAGRQLTTTVDGRLTAAIRRDLRDRSMIVSDHTDAEHPVEHELRWNRRNQLVLRHRDGRGPAWSYDADGHRTRLIGPDGRITSYSRDAAGRVIAVEHPDLGRATFDYDAAGRLVRVGAGDLIQTWEHTDGFVTGHTLTSAEGSTRTVIERDGWGRISRIDNGRAVRAYGYDQACQLIEQRTGDGTVATWRYDAAGRLAAEAVRGVRRQYGYDAAGRLISTTVSYPGTERRIEHRYDDAGRRVRTETSDGLVRAYGWSAGGRLAVVTETTAESSTTDRIRVDALDEPTMINDAELWWDTAAGAVPGLLEAAGVPVISTPGLTGVGTGWQAPGWRTGRGTATDPWAVADIAAPAAGIGIGAAGELTVAGLEWLGARVYDPASRGFLSADPLDPVPGAGWSGNPYAFAGNDPLHALDPTGLRPVTDAELKAYAASNNGALSAAGDWLGDNWEYVAGGAMVVAGGVLMATGVGGPAGVALLSAGADTIIQKATTGEVNWGEVAVSGVLGGVGGGAASWAARASTNGVRALATRAAVYGGVGAVGSEAGYVTKNHDKLSWRGALGAGVGGFFGGAVGAAGGPASGTLARALGRSTTSLTAKGIGAGLSFATGSSASVVNNLVSGQPINWTGAAISGGMGAGGSFIPPVVKSNGTSTLSQLSYFGPRTVSGVFNVGATNTGALWASTAQGAVTGYAAGMTIPPLLGQP